MPESRPVFTPVQRGGASTRERILDAAERLMRTLGLARVTTKEIARAAGCSEAALYKHFTGKEDLFVAMLKERLPNPVALLAELTRDPAARPIEQALAEIARQATAFYQTVMPIGCSLFAEPELLRRHREAMRAMDLGPQIPLETLAAYLRAEQAAGRLRAGADADAGASLLLGACFQRAFLQQFMGDDVLQQSLDDFAAHTARILLNGMG
ncbi:AcrR family transcriptional regulator [Thermocatellispora tengchongensis]|uniref:AcrR family transcriptional regulator n=1 Tax=Thermocatellispora tengchongensis TaxID=1073253 RepID=A0A840P5X5_9ACTN|nr:TetR/AcrR family transcriptional regulator [Thermocatellispora tengchongensis]MBB5133261.1 AcrR family transcriptional regulator [Thermocatellispora tengchongensis]